MLKSLQLCLTLWDSVPQSSSVRGILQARILKWVGTPSSRGSSWPRDQTWVSYISCIGRQVLFRYSHLGSPTSCVENPPANTEDAGEVGLIPGSERFPWSRKWQPTPVFLPGKSHGQSSLVGYSPWGGKELHTAKHTCKYGCIFLFLHCSLTLPIRFIVYFH